MEMITLDQNNKKEKKVCLEFRNVVKNFGAVRAVNDISLKIYEGEIFSFLGPSGCGKTTLLRLVAGMETLDKGNILINGRVINNDPPYKRNCSMVFQQHALFPHMTVAENIAFGLVERKFPKAEIKIKVSSKLDLVNLSGMEDRYPDQLSGGQRQRVALARSLILNPAVLLLDEPLAALDRKLRKEMQIELKRIQRKVGTTFLDVTHDQKEALSLSHRIAVMRNGKLVQVGSAEEIYESPQTEFVASFMGASNIFYGNVVVCNKNMIELEIGNGLKIVAPLKKDMPVDIICGVSVHPEMVGIAKNNADIGPFDPKNKTIFHGKIKNILYEGDYSEFTINLLETGSDITAFLVRGNQKNRYLENDDVIVYWDWSANNTLVA